MKPKRSYLVDKYKISNLKAISRNGQLDQLTIEEEKNTKKIYTKGQTARSKRAAKLLPNIA